MGAPRGTPPAAVRRRGIDRYPHIRRQGARLRLAPLDARCVHPARHVRNGLHPRRERRGGTGHLAVGSGAAALPARQRQRAAVGAATARRQFGDVGAAIPTRRRALPAAPARPGGRRARNAASALPAVVLSAILIREELPAGRVSRGRRFGVVPGTVPRRTWRGFTPR